MCIGIPMMILSSDDLIATAADGEREVLIDLALTGPLDAGTWVLTFLGSARAVLEEEEAHQILDALQGLRDIARGVTGRPDPFADIEARGPQLPPHLAAAHAAGRTQG